MKNNTFLYVKIMILLQQDHLKISEIELTGYVKFYLKRGNSHLSKNEGNILLCELAI